MKTSKTHMESKMPHYRLQFSIRTMLAFAILVGVSLAASKFLWPRRTVHSFVPVPRVSVELYAPYVDTFAANSDVIANIGIDARTNCLVVTSQARNLDAATREIGQWVHDEALVLSAPSMNFTLDQGQRFGESP